MEESQVRFTDRRIQRTRKLPQQALATLIRKKPYDRISVKEILDRADVGRSTFYTHFADKDDLLVSSIREILASARPAHPAISTAWYEPVVAFSLPVFEYINDHREASGVPIAPGRWATVHEQLQNVLTDSVAEHIREALPRRRNGAERVPADVLAQYVASTFIQVVNWWSKSKGQVSPKQADATFRELVVPTLAALRPGDKE